MAAPMEVVSTPIGYRSIDALAQRCHLLTAANGPAIAVSYPFLSSVYVHVYVV
jgi:hypothetical protein